MRCDLHVHTALSACAENLMSPRRVVEAARARDVELLAVTDHNASAHVRIVCHRARACGIAVLPALEVTSREEVHLLAYFAEIEHLEAFQRMVDEGLPDIPNDPEGFGPQVLYDAQDEIAALDERLRQVGTALSLDQIVERVHALGGLAVPAHIERPRHGLIAQLGFVDPEARFDALELRWQTWRREGRRPGDRQDGFALLSGSDAHFLNDVGRGAIDLPLASPTLDALRAALAIPRDPPRLQPPHSGERHA